MILVVCVNYRELILKMKFSCSDIVQSINNFELLILKCRYILLNDLVWILGQMYFIKIQFDWFFSNYLDVLNILEWVKKNVFVKVQIKILNYDGVLFMMVDILVVSEEWLGEGVYFLIMLVICVY